MKNGSTTPRTENSKRKSPRQRWIDNHPESLIVGSVLVVLLTGLVLSVVLTAPCVGEKGSIDPNGWSCGAPASQNAIYLRLKDFALGFGALIGVIGVLLGQAYGHDRIDIRSRQERDIARQNMAAHLSGEIAGYFAEYESVFSASCDILMTGIDLGYGESSSRKYLSLFRTEVENLRTFDATSKRFFSEFFSKEISDTGGKLFSTKMPQIPKETFTESLDEEDMILCFIYKITRYSERALIRINMLEQALSDIQKGKDHDVTELFNAITTAKLLKSRREHAIKRAKRELWEEGVQGSLISYDQIDKMADLE